MILEHYPEVLSLTPVEKLIFASELWNDLAGHSSEVPLSREIIQDLGKKMELACQGLSLHADRVEQPQTRNGFEVMPAQGRVVTQEFIRHLLEETYSC